MSYFDPASIATALKVNQPCVLWKYMHRDKQAKPAKVPVQPQSGVYPVSATDPNNWLPDYNTAQEWAMKHACGLGVALTGTPDDEGRYLMCIDLDATTDSAIEYVHKKLLAAARIAGAYIEQSPSGKGWHIWVWSFAPVLHSRAVLGVEVYTSGRFVTVTGHNASGDVVLITDELEELITPCLASGESAASADVAPINASLPVLSDAEVYAALGRHYGPAFFRLHNAEFDEARTQSVADYAWGTMVAKFVGHPEQWVRIYRASRLSHTLDRKGPHKNQMQYLGRTYMKARAAADTELYHIAVGREIAQALLARLQNPSSLAPQIRNSLYPNLLISNTDFVSRPASRAKLIRNLLGAGNFSVLWGAGGAGKSFVALSMADAIARGEPWAGLPTTQGSVVYATGEGINDLAQRSKAISISKGVSPDVPIYFLPEAMSAPDDTNKLLAQLAYAEEATGQPPALLILDTLMRFFGTSDDENSTLGMTNFVRAIASLIKQYPSLHVLVVHHSGKSADNGMRGSSVLTPATDTVIHCKNTSAGHECVVDRQKESEAGIKFPFQLKQVDLGVDDEGIPINSCVVEFDGPVATTAAPMPQRSPTTGRKLPRITEFTAVAIRVLHKLKKAEHAEGKGGNLMTSIPYAAFRNYWLLFSDDGKSSDTRRKRGISQLETLILHQAIEWDGGENPIVVLPGFDRLVQRYCREEVKSD